MSIYSTPESKNRKNDRVARRGSKLSTFLLQLEGDPLEKKQIFENSQNAKKLKGGPFGNFKHPFFCKISKKLNEGPFGEK